ncbi:MAG: hypothetical protein BRD50_09245 [Bacteroidetes bacterium SW_11_45_7]|nr:MAG: hypothetical protein BRD50_09245 [Bacteroidetes bacterium SW_11_45_7]
MPQEITFLTRHYPPNPNINGESIWDMVKYLQDHYNIKCNILCIDRTFEGGGADREPVGHVTNIKTPYQGRNALLRFITFLYDGLMLALKARKFKHSLIVCSTSPPLLPFWCSLLFGKEIDWCLWTFDLFPEFFAVTGKISPKNPLYKGAKSKTYQGDPNLLIALGPKQAEHLKKEFQQDLATIILPCGVLFHQDKSYDEPDWLQKNKITLGYCGNLGDAHNPEFIKAVIDHIEPEKHQLVLALYGSKAAEVKEYAKNKEGVVLVDRVARNKLHFIQIHLVTLYTSWTHIAVPSKAVSAIASNSCILFCGDRNSDNWYMLQDAGWLIDENDRIDDQVANFLKQLTLNKVEEKIDQTPALYRNLQSRVYEAYNKMAHYVQSKNH